MAIETLLDKLNKTTYNISAFHDELGPLDIIENQSFEDTLRYAFIQMDHQEGWIFETIEDILSDLYNIEIDPEFDNGNPINYVNYFFTNSTPYIESFIHELKQILSKTNANEFHLSNDYFHIKINLNNKNKMPFAIYVEGDLHIFAKPKTTEIEKLDKEKITQFALLCKSLGDRAFRSYTDHTGKNDNKHFYVGIKLSNGYTNSEKYYWKKLPNEEWNRFRDVRITQKAPILNDSVNISELYELFK